MQLGPTELIIILVIVVIFFGVGRLPDVFGSVGKGLREFRSAVKEEEEAGKPAKTLERHETAEPVVIAPVAAEPVAKQAAEAQVAETEESQPER